MRCRCVSRSPHGAKRNAGQVSRISLRSIRATIAALALISVAIAQEQPDETPAPEQEQAAAPTPEKPAPPPSGEATESICLLIESAAAANGLPVEFFARVIWRESHYNPNAVGPLTRSGERAQGIGQFMPGTAAERRLLDPFDPVEALPKSAEFLRDLRGQFGNLGLAAAAYNAGPQRVRDWLAGRRTLPRETRNYVAAVTGRGVDEWAALGATSREQKPPPAPPCNELQVIIKRAPNTFVAELEKHVSEGVASPWGVQLSAGFSRNKALAIYATIERKYRTVLAGHDPMIIRARLLTRGTSAFYQVRAGAGTRAEADKLCTGLRRAGGHCLVLRNPRG
jgi:Transglycosylase SLT domain/SPOR domain